MTEHQVKAAYVADDGTEMIEIAPHQTVNRCAHDERQHHWTPIMRGRGRLFCTWCGKQI